VTKLILYPSKRTRRFVSLEKVLVLGFKQIMLFGILFLISNLFMGFPIEKSFKHLGVVALAVIGSKVSFVLFLKFYRSLGYSYSRFITIGKFPDVDLVVGYLTNNPRTGNQFVAHFNELEKIGDIHTYIIKNDVKEIYCNSQSLSNADLSKLMRVSLKHDIPLSLMADDDLSSIDSEAINIDSPDIGDISQLMSRRSLIFKRLFDLAISTFVMVGILSWLIPLVGIIIKLDSKGPIFFLQPRAGRNGVYFYCFKFRSMRASSSDAQASKNDDRITRFGKFLRSSSLDEFPQFINVFLGHMSIVGPRPHIKSLNDKYDQKIKRYGDRLLVKPGITGLSQITGYRGETKDQQSMQNRIRVDLLYIKRWSLSLDLKIFLRTFFKTFFAKDSQAY
tara:strand:+ start:1057 stop:2229 length:1173 start_codon:yes stop_codon:yes gene_type:complete